MVENKKKKKKLQPGQAGVGTARGLKRDKKPLSEGGVSIGGKKATPKDIERINKKAELPAKNRAVVEKRRAGKKEEQIQSGKIFEEFREQRDKSKPESKAEFQEFKKNREEAEEPELEPPIIEKVQGEEAETIETETIIQTDDAGFKREIQMPIGTTAKIAEASARREGRVPLNELPEYQQFLAGAAIGGASPKAIIGSGRTIQKGLKEISTVMQGTFGKYVGQIAAGSGIITWLASDNIIGTMSIYGRDLAEDVTFGKIDRQTALNKFDEGTAFVEKGRNFIKTATLLNPLLWPFRKIILANADAADLSLTENRNRITGEDRILEEE